MRIDSWQELTTHIILQSLEPTDNHIRVLEDRFLFAARRREELLKRNPDFTEAQLWAIDQDLAQKKLELEQALDEQRRQNRLNSNNK